MRRPGLFCVGWMVLAACGEAETCASRFAGLCGPGFTREVALRVDGAIAVDFDGDGREDFIAIDRDARQLGLARADGVNMSVYLDATPTGVVQVGGEVIVGLSQPAGLAVFGADEEGLLAHRRDIALAEDVEALWAGDLDGDEETEVVAALASAGKIAVVDPRSGASKMFAAGSYPVAIAVGDLDGDGIRDLVVADYTREAVQALRGAGSGSLRAAQEFMVGVPIDSIELADIDGDGAVDVLARGAAEAAVVYLHNDGGGRLGAPMSLPLLVSAEGVGLVASPPAKSGVVGVSVPQGDVISTWYTQGGAPWLGHEEEYGEKGMQWIGRASPSGFLAGGESVVDRFEYTEALTPVEMWRKRLKGRYFDKVAAGDIDGDGLVDIAAVVGEELLTFIADGAGGFELAARSDLDVEVRGLLVTDVTGDGRVDIVVHEPTSVRVLTGEELESQAAFVPAVESLHIVVARMADPDQPAILAVGGGLNHEHVVFLKDGISLLRLGSDGQVIAESVVLEGMALRHTAPLDLEGDGVEELLVYANDEGTPLLTWLAADGESFVEGPRIDLAALSGLAASDFDMHEFLVGDVDEDGEVDVLVDADKETVIASHIGDVPAATLRPGGLYATDLRDVDGDGHLDIVNVSDGSSVYFLGRGDGTFEDYQFGVVPGSVAQALAPAGAQFDLVTLTSSSLAVHRFREVMNAIRSEHGEFTNFMGKTSEHALRDLDGDGTDDIVTTSGDHGVLSVLWGVRDGRPMRMEGRGGLYSARGLEFVDLDEDGREEVLTLDRLVRFGPERATEGLLFTDVYSVCDIEMMDVDGDGRHDLLVLRDLQSWPMSVMISYGSDSGEFSTFESLLERDDFNRGTLEVGDVNGDGRLDVLVRPTGAVSSSLLLARGGRAWSEGVKLASRSATFVPRDGEGVDLLVQDDERIRRVVVEGTLLVARETVLEDASLAEARLGQVVDVDGDGATDLLIEGEARTEIWLRTGAGFERGLSVPGTEMKRIEVGDVDGDGRMDLVGRLDGRIAMRLSSTKE